MLNPQVKVNTKQLSDYVFKHNLNFKSRVGFLNQKPRLKVAHSLGKVTAYGIRRGTGRKKAPLSNPQVAYSNIMGGGGKPARNFFKLAGSKKYWEEKNFNFLKQYFSKTPHVSQTRNAWNNLGRTVLKRSIFDFSFPANAAKTIKKKGFNKPLIDSQQMLKSIEAKSYDGN